jgi:hypothetical protein
MVLKPIVSDMIGLNLGKPHIKYMTLKQERRYWSMNKQRFKNVYRSFRLMKRRCTIQETLAWIGFYSQYDRHILEKLLKTEKLIKSKNLLM